MSPKSSDLPPIYFYIPREDWPTDSIPETPNVYWPNFGGGITAGVYAWTVQTYQYLKARGLPCQLVGELPSEGIVFSHRRSMPDDFKPGPNVLFVCLKAERNRHPYAQLHVVGNPLDLQPQTLVPGDRWLLSNERQYIPHWPQPGLIPRDPERGDRFENIAFFGEGRSGRPRISPAILGRTPQRPGIDLASGRSRPTRSLERLQLRRCDRRRPSVSQHG